MSTALQGQLARIWIGLSHVSQWVRIVNAHFNFVLKYCGSSEPEGADPRKLDIRNCGVDLRGS